MPQHQLPPIVPRELRTRVAVPMGPPPVLRPSLIPVDVLQDVAREAQREAVDDSFDGEIRTAPIPVEGDFPILGTVTADLEVAYFALTQVPMFKDLPVASLEAMAEGAIQLEVPDGEFLFMEGDDATSFFVVVDGTLELLRHKDGREVALRHAKKGEAFGLFGLFSAQLRAASSRAIGDCTILEISSEKLQKLLAADEVIHQRLLTFYRERLVEGFMASRLFGDIDSIARARLIGRFTNRELDAGEALLSPGEVSNLIAVVTHGRLILEDRAKVGQAPREFEVTQGQFVAITCAISGQPSKLRVLAPEFATLSVLSHKDLNELMRDYPALRSLPARLPHFARGLDRDVFCGSTGVPGL
ncbi:MAG: cyclic nucleotide-binding domain-containing protein [Archangium sp.]|nr:cyclic nucleotide-binding domain-containing protein [Archangium sp.]